MLSRDEMTYIAAKKAEEIYGKPYLQENSKKFCVAEGFIEDDVFQVFFGFKDSDDLPDREADDHGWVVRMLIRINANTGDFVFCDYSSE